MVTTRDEKCRTTEGHAREKASQNWQGKKATAHGAVDGPRARNLQASSIPQTRNEYNLTCASMRSERAIPPRQKAGIDVLGARSVALRHLLTTSAWRPFWKCAFSKTASAAGRTGRYLSCERAQTVCRKRGGGRPRKNGRGGGSPAATRRPRHLVPLGPRPRPADRSVMHVSLSKYLRKAAPTPPELALFFFAPVTTGLVLTNIASI